MILSTPISSRINPTATSVASVGGYNPTIGKSTSQTPSAISIKAKSISKKLEAAADVEINNVIKAAMSRPENKWVLDSMKKITKCFKHLEKEIDRLWKNKIISLDDHDNLSLYFTIAAFESFLSDDFEKASHLFETRVEGEIESFVENRSLLENNLSEELVQEMEEVAGEYSDVGNYIKDILMSTLK